jgi:hypothetical protein
LLSYRRLQQPREISPHRLASLLVGLLEHAKEVVFVLEALGAFPVLDAPGVVGLQEQDYLNEFTFRFNRRFYPMTAFNSVLGIAARTIPPTYAELYSGEWHVAA